jgi:hypothetical protein
MKADEQARQKAKESDEKLATQPKTIFASLLSSPKPKPETEKKPPGKSYPG